MAKEQAAPKYDRSKYKGTSVAKLNEQEQEVKSMIPTASSDGRPEFHKLEEGKNYFRIYPAKEGESTYIFPKATSWLPFDVDEEDDKGKKKKDKKRTKKPIFNSKVHGNYPYDLVEEFCKVAIRLVHTNIQDPEEVKKKLWPLQSWGSGLQASVNWVAYADKCSDAKNSKDTKKIFGRLEIWENIYKEMKKKAAAMADDDEELADPFSDPDQGKLLVITKTSKPKKGGGTTADYDVSINFSRDYSLTDEELMKFDSQEKLSDMFLNAFKRSDFEKQIEGLTLVDEEHEFGVFDDPDFLEILDKLDGLIPVDEEEEEAFDLSKMDRKAMKEFIKEKGFGIKVISSMTDDKLRGLIQDEIDELAAKANLEDEEEEEELEEEEEIEDEKPDPNDEKPDFLKDDAPEKEDSDDEEEEDDEETEKRLKAYRERKSGAGSKNTNKDKNK